MSFFKSCSLFSAAVLIFSTILQIEGRQVGSKTVIRASGPSDLLNSTGECNVTFKSEMAQNTPANCLESDVQSGKSFPVLGNCTISVKCVLNGSMLYYHPQTTPCPTGQIFDIQQEKCTESADVNNCTQTVCAALLQKALKSEKAAEAATAAPEAEEKKPDDSKVNKNDEHENHSEDIKPDDIKSPENQDHQEAKPDEKTKETEKPKDENKSGKLKVENSDTNTHEDQKAVKAESSNSGSVGLQTCEGIFTLSAIILSLG